MAVLRVCFAVALILLGGGFGARAEDGPATPNGLYDRPVLVVDPGMHIAEIRRASADRDGRWAVTGRWRTARWRARSGCRPGP